MSFEIFVPLHVIRPPLIVTFAALAFLFRDPQRSCLLRMIGPHMPVPILGFCTTSSTYLTYSGPVVVLLMFPVHMERELALMLC